MFKKLKQKILLKIIFLKYDIKKFIKKTSDLLFRFFRSGLIILIVAIIIAIAVFLIYSGLYLLEYWKPVHDFYGYSEEAQKAHELHFQFARNFGWIVWMGISLVGLFLTLILTIWGRIIQVGQKKTQHISHLHDRYEKAAHMLGSEVMAVRVAGCRALMSLGKYDGNMKEQCVRLLFSFIRHPYLEDKDKDKKLDEVFPIDKALRDDIQEASDSLSAICKHHSKAVKDEEELVLPDYFLRNEKKKIISLIGANLGGMECRKSYLLRANLQEVNLNSADLQEANLIEANLRGAKLYFAQLQKANLYSASLQKAELWWARLQGAKLYLAQLQKANLVNANLEETILMSVNLKKANLKDANMQGAILMLANLKKANLKDTNLKNAILTLTNMQGVKHLTKEQILSAIWGINKKGDGGPPKLSKKLAKYPEVKKWLATPHFDLRKKKEGG